LIFASSVSVFGPCQHKEPPRRASEPVAPSDHYTHSKVRCEEMVREARLDWVILRFSAVIPLKIDGSAEIDFDGFFKTDPNSRIEYVHPADVGLAQVRALDCGEATGKVLLIGGGKDSQIYMRDLNGAIFGAIGIGGFRDSMFGDAPFYTDWLDTEESQRLLQFQRHDFESHIQDFCHRMRWIRRLIWPLRWPIRMYLKRKSAKVVG
jgi:nucleoside-diphosphate-sugar epimerase